MTTKATEGATATEKTVEKAQTIENMSATQKSVKLADTQSESVKLIYIGPNLPKAMLQCNKIFEGTKEEISRELAEILEKFPLVEKMLVPVSELAEKKDKVKTAGNIYNKYYSDLKACAVAYLQGGINNE